MPPMYRHFLYNSIYFPESFDIAKLAIRKINVTGNSLMKSKPFRVGWIIGDQLNQARFYHRVNVDAGGIALNRFKWIASHVNSTAGFGLKYEIYQPWKKYDALLFLKSMGTKSINLLHKKQQQGCASIFDINVNYFESSGREYYAGMLPTEQQKRDVIGMTQAADGIIADSTFLEEKCARYNKKTAWIPDNVCMQLVPPCTTWNFKGRRLPLLWSGEAVKLFDLLAIEDVLVKYADSIELNLITNSLDAMDYWHDGYKTRFESMLSKVPHKIIPYQSIESLLKVYSLGGVFISPRFIDNSYNKGHTEWKITLAMACGRMALASPVPSYVNVSDFSKGRGIKICDTSEKWEETLDAILSEEIDIEAEEMASRAVVESHYSTSVVAVKHAHFVNDVISGRKKSCE